MCSRLFRATPRRDTGRQTLRYEANLRGRQALREPASRMPQKLRNHRNPCPKYQSGTSEWRRPFGSRSEQFDRARCTIEAVDGGGPSCEYQLIPPSRVVPLVEDSSDLVVEFATIEIRDCLGAVRGCRLGLQRDLVVALVSDQVE
jgi:hypothetical protein